MEVQKICGNACQKQILRMHTTSLNFGILAQNLKHFHTTDLLQRKIL